MKIIIHLFALIMLQLSLIIYLLSTSNKPSTFVEVRPLESILLETITALITIIMVSEEGNTYTYPTFSQGAITYGVLIQLSSAIAFLTKKSSFLMHTALYEFWPLRHTAEQAKDSAT